MTSNPGEWYVERAEEARAFRRVLKKARDLQAHAEKIALEKKDYGEEVAFRMRVVGWLVRELERAEYVGD